MELIAAHEISFLFLRKAKLLLKKKRYQEQLLDKTEVQISNLEQMVRNFLVLLMWAINASDHESKNNLFMCLLFKYGRF